MNEAKQKQKRFIHSVLDDSMVDGVRTNIWVGVMCVTTNFARAVLNADVRLIRSREACGKAGSDINGFDRSS